MIFDGIKYIVDAVLPEGLCGLTMKYKHDLYMSQDNSVHSTCFILFSCVSSPQY